MVLNFNIGVWSRSEGRPWVGQYLGVSRITSVWGEAEKGRWALLHEGWR